MRFGVLDRFAFEHMFRYEVLRAGSDGRSLVFAVLDLEMSAAPTVSAVLGPHEIVGDWGTGLAVIFPGSTHDEVRAALDHVFAAVKAMIPGANPGGVVHEVLPNAPASLQAESDRHRQAGS